MSFHVRIALRIRRNGPTVVRVTGGRVVLGEQYPSGPEHKATGVDTCVKDVVRLSTLPLSLVSPAIPCQWICLSWVEGRECVAVHGRPPSPRCYSLMPLNFRCPLLWKVAKRQVSKPTLSRLLMPYFEVLEPRLRGPSRPRQERLFLEQNKCTAGQSRRDSVPEAFDIWREHYNC